MYAFVSVIRKAPVVQKNHLPKTNYIQDSTQLYLKRHPQPSQKKPNFDVFFFFPKNAQQLLTSVSAGFEPLKVFSCTVSSSWLFCGGSTGLVVGLDVNSGELRYFGRWIFCLGEWIDFYPWLIKWGVTNHLQVLG